MKRYKVLHIYNQCANTTIPLQAFLQINDIRMSKLILSWNQKRNDNDYIYYSHGPSNVVYDGLGFKDRSLLKVLILFYKYIKTEKPDLIHLHHSYSAFFGSLMGRIMNINVILTIHSDYSMYTFTNKCLFWVSMFFSTRIVANSKNTLCSIPAYYRKKTVVIYNGVDLDAIYSSKRIAQKYSDEFIVCTVSRLVELKDHRTLIDGFKLLSRKYQNVKLYIIGDGPERKDLEEYANSRMLSDQITFFGKVIREDVYSILKTSDVFCSTSKWEGFGNSIVEAMASKIPVISSKIPVTKEVIGQNNALFFEVGNYKELFLQIEKLYLNHGLRDELANKSFEKSKEFSLEKNAYNHIDLYNNILT